MAEYVLQDIVRKLGMQDQFLIASAATSTEEIGNDVHDGAMQVLQEHQIPCPPRHARQMTKHDYETYDYLIGMDSHNIHNMLNIAGKDTQQKILLCLAFTDEQGDIADPWYTGNFKKTYEQVTKGCTSLLHHIIKTSIDF